MEGKILIDGIDIKEYDLKCLRGQFGIVSQEPVLFNGTIRENIIYNSGVSYDDMETVKKAASDANALTFIQKNEFIEIKDKVFKDEKDKAQSNNSGGSGFDKKVGPKGSQISGGQ